MNVLINLKRIQKYCFTQIPIAVGYYLIAPFGNQYYSYFGECYTEGQQSCVKWFVNEMLTLEKNAYNYLQTNLELQIPPQEEDSFQLAEECWLCEAIFAECEELFDSLTQNAKVRDHDHLTGHYRGAAHSKCNIIVKQKQSRFVPMFCMYDVLFYDVCFV